MEHIVHTTGLSKAYRSAEVVSDLDLRVPQGCVYGLLGPNGSGKSTTMKMLLSLVRPTAGEVLLFGEEMNRATRAHLLERVGSLIESPSVYGHLTGAENMRIVQGLLGADDAAISRAVAAVRMEKQMGKRVREFSLGMKQRLGIAMALARDPQLLILDEPTNGLDPAGIEEIRDLVVSLARDDGRTVIVSSHLLSEIERMASVLGILDRGRLIFQGTKGDLFDARRPDLFIRTPRADEAAAELCGYQHGFSDAGIVLHDLDERSGGAAIARPVTAGVPVLEARREQRSLEDVFIGLTGREGLS